MEATELTQDLIEKLGEEVQIEMIIESSLKLALSLQRFKMTDKKEGYTEYVESYNDVCGRIAETELMIEQSQFIFNRNEIDKHHELMLNHLKEKMKEY